jgi:hypothetical protein
MPPRFSPGAAAYAKDGRRYIVDEVEDGTVYCSSESGAETEFAAAQLMNEAEWAARSSGRRDTIYVAVKQARAYAPYKGPIDRAGAQKLLDKAERLYPGILDFTAFTVASRAVAETDSQDLAAELSIVKCREIFDAAKPQTRATLLAGLIGAPPDRAVSAAGLGDNLMRAMIEKGLSAGPVSFDAFRARKRQ